MESQGLRPLGIGIFTCQEIVYIKLQLGTVNVHKHSENLLLFFPCFTGNSIYEFGCLTHLFFPRVSVWQAQF